MSHPVQTVNYFSEWLQFHRPNLAKLPLNTNSDFVQLDGESKNSVEELRRRNGFFHFQTFWSFDD